MNSSNLFAINIGFESGYINQSTFAIAFGHEAGRLQQYTGATSIGYNAGKDNQGTRSISVGWQSGYYHQQSDSIAIGSFAGMTQQKQNSIAIGYEAGNEHQSEYGVAIGYGAGKENQSSHAIAIGYNAGNLNQAMNSIIIGNQVNSTFSNSIVLYADNTPFDTTNDGLFISPIKEKATNKVLYYNTDSKEISYNNVTEFYERRGKSTMKMGYIAPYCSAVCNITFSSPLIAPPDFAVVTPSWKLPPPTGQKSYADPRMLQISVLLSSLTQGGFDVQLYNPSATTSIKVGECELFYIAGPSL